MPLCSHCLPITTPPFLALAPRLCSPSKLFASPRSRYLGPRMRNKGMDIFLRPRRHGVRVRSSSGKGDNRTVNNAPVDRFVKRRKIVEHVILLQAKMELSDVDEKDMLDFMYTSQYHMRGIIALSLGSNFSNGDSEYTHAAIIRFYTLQAFEMFRCSPKYNDMWKSKFQPITKKSLLIHFNVDPVGTELL